MFRVILFFFLGMFARATFAQSTELGDIRGFVYNADNGDRIAAASIFVAEKSLIAQTDVDGFFAVPNLPAGIYSVFCFKAGYDTLFQKVSVQPGANAKRDFFLTQIQSIEAVEISVRGKSKDAQVSVQNVNAKVLAKLPAIGAEPDLVQYLQVLPGVVFSGDQGGQLYIRGGSPVMNRVMIDGMTIYNPFHSIGLFSVFDPDMMDNADVYTAGFGAEYGGRVSAVIDVKTRDGDRNRLRTKVGVTTFTSKILLEGPIKKFKALRR